MKSMPETRVVDYDNTAGCLVTVVILVLLLGCVWQIEKYVRGIEDAVRDIKDTARDIRDSNLRIQAIREATP